MDRLVSVPSSLVNGRSRSMSCGFDPETGRFLFFSSAFRSLTFISSSRIALRPGAASPFCCCWDEEPELAAGELATDDKPEQNKIQSSIQPSLFRNSMEFIATIFLFVCLYVSRSWTATSVSWGLRNMNCKFLCDSLWIFRFFFFWNPPQFGILK